MAKDKVVIEIDGDDSGYTQVLNNLSKKTIATIAKGSALVAGAFGAMTVAALKYKGELEQNLGGSEAVFKEHASSMQKTAEDAYKNMGLSASDYLATANKMGALMQGSGISIKDSAELSAQAMQRAADVASIMGIDINFAMESIAGAAKGNFTMMDNLGVAMNATTLQAYALSKGIKTTYANMDNATKVQLAMEMFLEKTSYAAGNYAKENETLSGALTTAKASLTNFLSGSGDVDQMVDSFSNAADVVVENLQEIVPRLISSFKELPPKLKPLAEDVIKALAPGDTGEHLSSIFNNVVDIATTAIETVSSAISAVAPIAVGALDAISGGADVLIPMLIGGVSAWTVWTGAIKAATAVKAAYAAVTSITTGGIGLLVTGLAAGVVGFSAWMISTNESVKKQKEFNKECEITISEINSLIEAEERRKETVKKQLSADLAQIKNTERLAEELDKLCDENGKVQDSDKARAQFILGELNKALGTEYSMTGNVIDNYKELQKTVQELIAEKKYNILSDVIGEEYKQALAGSDELIKNYSDLARKYSKQLKEAGYDLSAKGLFTAEGILANSKIENLEEIAPGFEKARDAMFDFYKTQTVWEESNRIWAENGVEDAYKYLDSYVNSAWGVNDALSASAAGQKNTLDELGTAYFNSLLNLELTLANYDGSQASTAMVNSALEAAREAGVKFEEAGGTLSQNLISGMEGESIDISGLSKALEPELIRFGYNFVDGTLIGIEGSMPNLTKVSTDLYTDALKSGEPQLTKAGKKTGEETAKSFAIGTKISEPTVVKRFKEIGKGGINAFNDEAKSAKTSGSDVISQFEAGLNDEQRAFLEKVKTIGVEGISTLDDSTIGSEDVGYNLALGVGVGLENGDGPLQLIAAQIIFNAISAMQAAGGIQSPSKETRDTVGLMLSAGVGVGIENGQEALNAIAASSVESTISSMEEAGGMMPWSRETRDRVGEKLMEGIAKGISDGQSNVDKAVENMGESILSKEDYYLNEAKRAEQDAINTTFANELIAAKTTDEKRAIIEERARKRAEETGDSYNDALNDTIDDANDILEAHSDDVEENQERISDAFEETWDKAMDKLDEYDQKWKDFIDDKEDFADKLGDGVNITREYSVEYAGKDGERVTKNWNGINTAGLRNENERIEEYGNNLLKLKDIVPESLYNEVFENMSREEGQQFMDAFFRMSEGQREEFIKEWQRYQDNIASTTDKVFEEEEQALVAEGETLADELITQFDQIPEEFFGIGDLSAQKFGEGFREKLGNVLSEASMYIKEFFSGNGSSPLYTQIAGGGVTNIYEDNSTTTITANDVTAHDIIAEKEQSDTYNSHTRGW